MNPSRMYLLAAAAAFAFAVHLWLHPPPVPVLLLHDVKTGREGWDFWTIAPDRFEEIVRMLDRLGYRGLTLAEVRAHLAGALPLGRARRGILITVDDGAASAAKLVGPRLARSGHAASFFVVSGWGPPDHVAPADARALVAAGHDVGSHSMTHAGLAVRPRAPGERERIAAELAGSMTRVAGWAGRPVVALAYPKGEYDRTTRELARQAGYALAFTTDLGYLEPGADPMELPRFQLNWDTPLPWIEEYVTAPARERNRNLILVALIGLLAMAGALVSRLNPPPPPPSGD
jgi:peptidoglycan/xylan/chitin deacetylase (PgdA/CDA1 family)